MDNYLTGVDLEYARLQNIIAVSRKPQWLFQPKNLTTLMDIFAYDRELFYRLACVGVLPNASQPMRQLAASAVTLRMISFSGACFNEPRKGSGWLLDATKNIPGAWFDFTAEEHDRARSFMVVLCGRLEKTIFFTEQNPGDSFDGTAKSKFELAFQNSAAMDAAFTYQFVRYATPPAEFNRQACLDSVMCRLREANYVAMSPLFPVRIVSGETKAEALEKFATTINDMTDFSGYKKPSG